MNSIPCLFCRSNGPFTTVEHVIPESLGNDDLLLDGHVCDKCQTYFGAKLERYVLEKSPVGFWRTFLGTTTKKGRRPSVDMSQPRKSGLLPATHGYHDDLAFQSHADESVEITKISPEILREIREGTRTEFRVVFTPHMLYMLGRFLCKVGIELLCIADPANARASRFDAARDYARFGRSRPLWPILWAQDGEICDLKRWKRDELGLSVEYECYTFWIGDVGAHCMFGFGIGTDRYWIALDEALCPLLLEVASDNPGSHVLWYPPDSY